LPRTNSNRVNTVNVSAITNYLRIRQRIDTEGQMMAYVGWGKYCFCRSCLTMSWKCKKKKELQIRSYNSVTYTQMNVNR